MRSAEFISGGRRLSANIFEPEPELVRRPAILFVHGWHSSKSGYGVRAAAVTEQLGAVCVTFDLGGHADSEGVLNQLSPRDHLLDCEATFDALVSHPQVNPARVGVCGASYGGYLSALLTGRRDVSKLLLRAPSLHGDHAIDTPPGLMEELDGHCDARQLFKGLAASRAKVLILESEHDEVIPHSVIEAYLRGCPRAHYEVLAGARHALREPVIEAGFVAAIISWFADL
jgi:pimeloyl-ACP methyl ester carboxylesterase